MFSRRLELPVGRKSFFLFGPRQTGKSTLIRLLLSGKTHMEINLLKSDVLLKYKKRPDLLRRETDFLVKSDPSSIVFIDEIQKAPELLNEIHLLIEKYPQKVSFIMTGSSARKLKRASVNMLGGRAWEFRLHPLTHVELGNDFQLDTVLLKGSLPPIVKEGSEDASQSLQAYTATYLKEEILDEALTRNISAFSRFLDLAADQSGRIVNFSTISREAGVTSKTIKGYYEILEDTLVALKLEPFLKSARKRLVLHPKYYLFDLGCINSLTGRAYPSAISSPTVYGILFEHFIILEIFRLLTYGRQFFRIFHWRSSHGAEVDLVLEKENRVFAIEIKSAPIVHAGDLRGLRSFIADYPHATPLCISTAERPYMAGDIPVIPWQMAFEADYLNIL